MEDCLEYEKKNLPESSEWMTGVLNKEQTGLAPVACNVNKAKAVERSVHTSFS